MRAHICTEINICEYVTRI